MRGNKLFKFIDRYAGISLLYILKAVNFIVPFQRFIKRDEKTCLIIKQSALGDTILMLPAIKKIKLSGYRVVMIATKVNKAAADACPYIDELLVFEPSSIKNPVKLIKFIRAVYLSKATLALDFDQWLRVSPLLAFLSGAKTRIGFDTKGQSRAVLYTKKVSRDPKKHEAENFFEIAKAAGFAMSEEEKKLFFLITKEEKEAANANIKSMELGSAYAVIHPGCGSHGWQRQWPEERYAKTAEFLAEKGLKTAVTAGPEEIKIYEKIRGLSKADVKLIKTSSIGELAHIIAGAKVFISGNTGIMHLAAASGASVIALHGPTDPVKWAPYAADAVILKPGLPCSPCLDLGFEYGCADRKCMEAITVEMVEEALLKVIG